LAPGTCCSRTDEALKQAPVAKQLCNCTLKFTAAQTQHVLALRQPALGAPVVVDIEKPGSTKWNIGDLPIGKQVFLEVTRVEGLKDSMIEPKQVASGDLLTVWLGESNKSLPLGIKLDTSSTARDVESSCSWSSSSRIKSRGSIAARNCSRSIKSRCNWS
jgi:hypothetical protein